MRHHSSSSNMIGKLVGFLAVLAFVQFASCGESGVAERKTSRGSLPKQALLDYLVGGNRRTVRAERTLNRISNNEDADGDSSARRKKFDFLQSLGLASEMLSDMLGDLISETSPGVKARKGNSLDFLDFLGRLESTITQIAKDEDCAPVLELIDQTVYTVKEFLDLTIAARNLENIWVNMKQKDSFTGCIVTPVVFSSVMQSSKSYPFLDSMISDLLVKNLSTRK